MNLDVSQEQVGWETRLQVRWIVLPTRGISYRPQSCPCNCTLLTSECTLFTCECTPVLCLVAKLQYDITAVLRDNRAAANILSNMMEGLLD